MTQQTDLLELEDQIQSLEIDLVRLQRDVEGQDIEHSVKDRFSSLKERIASLRDPKQKREIAMLRLQESSKREASKTLDDLIRLDQERQEKVRHLRLCQLVFEANLPLKRRQISSSKMIWIEKTIIEKKIIGYESLHGDKKGQPIFGDSERKERHLVPLHQLDSFLRDGWRVEPPDQDVTAEILTGENSMLVPSQSLAEVFERARDVAGDSYFMVDVTLRPREVDEFAKSLK
jgi:hypothetical protein